MPYVNPLVADKKIQANLARISDDYYMKMKRHRIRQEDVAKLTGVHQSAVSQQFTNRRLKLETMLAIDQLVADQAKALGG